MRPSGWLGFGWARAGLPEYFQNNWLPALCQIGDKIVQLIWRSFAMGNYPELSLGCYGELRSAQRFVDELRPLVPDIESRDYRLVLEPGKDEKAAIPIRKLVKRGLIKVLWTDSPAITTVLAPDPLHVGLVWCVRRLKEDHAGLWQTFWDAHWACAVASNEFMALCLERKVVSDRDIELGKAGVYEGPFPGAPQGWHAFPYFGRIVVDWTYRQVDINCKIPHIYRLPIGHRFPQPGIDYNPRDFEAWRPCCDYDDD
jgi:hypothetical protein